MPSSVSKMPPPPQKSTFFLKFVRILQNIESGLVNDLYWYGEEEIAIDWYHERGETIGTEDAGGNAHADAVLLVPRK